MEWSFQVTAGKVDIVVDAVISGTVGRGVPTTKPWTSSRTEDENEIHQWWRSERQGRLQKGTDETIRGRKTKCTRKRDNARRASSSASEENKPIVDELREHAVRSDRKERQQRSNSITRERPIYAKRYWSQALRTRRKQWGRTRRTWQQRRPCADIGVREPGWIEQVAEIGANQTSAWSLWTVGVNVQYISKLWVTIDLALE